MPNATAFFRDNQSHHWFTPFPGERVATHVTGDQTERKFACGEAMIEPGSGQPLHRHTNLDELLYVLEGEIDFSVGGKRFRTGPGGFAFIPKDSIHGFRNLGTVPARMLGVFSPSNMDGFFEAMQGQPMSAFEEIAGRYGIEIVGPMIEPI